MEQTESAKGEGFMAMNPVPTAERQSFLQRKNIVFSLHRYGIEALGAMALGLFSSLIVGLIISIFQTVTSIQEQTLTFVPKIIAIFLTLILLGSWMMNTMVEYTVQLWSSFSQYVHR